MIHISKASNNSLKSHTEEWPAPSKRPINNHKMGSRTSPTQHLCTDALLSLGTHCSMSPSGYLRFEQIERIRTRFSPLHCFHFCLSPPHAPFPTQVPILVLSELNLSHTTPRFAHAPDTLASRHCCVIVAFKKTPRITACYSLLGMQKNKAKYPPSSQAPPSNSCSALRRWNARDAVSFTHSSQWFSQAPSAKRRLWWFGQKSPQ